MQFKLLLHLTISSSTFAPFASTKYKFASLFFQPYQQGLDHNYIPGQTGKFSKVLSVTPKADFNMFSLKILCGSSPWSILLPKNSTVSGLKSFEGNVLFRKEEKGLTPSTWLLHHLFRYLEEKK